MEVSVVEDDEFLYRSVRDDPNCFAIIGGLCRLSSSAFNDAGCKPSVDRAVLVQNNPAISQKGPEQGVVTLLASEVRAIAPLVQYDASGKNKKSVHLVDVLHAPILVNLAHAQVEASPAITGSGVMKRLKESLCRLADTRGWTIPPESQRGT
jgi:hypothetical protein